MSVGLSYAAVTPARDEAGNLPRLASCLAAQTVVPSKWILVDNGSSDQTPELAADLAARYSWVEVIHVPNEVTRPGAPVVRAFNAGLEALDGAFDVVVKLDADVSFDSDYFEGLLLAFEDDPALGIASGECFELEAGEWRPVFVTGDHVRGATRAYRARCLSEIGRLPEEMGWDGVDELKASILGWRTKSLADRHFFHHRAVGERDGAWARWFAEGRCAYYMGYRVSYLAARTVGRAIRDRDLAAFAMPWAFLVATIRRDQRYDDELVRRYLRSQQSLRFLPIRFLESFGVRRAHNRG